MKRHVTKRWITGMMFPLMAVMSGCYIQETPCYYGFDGAQGRSFFGIDWVEDMPSYLWTNNTSIPPVFQYNSYYQSYVGSYELYYEGEFIEECCPKAYQWDVFFDVWAHPGTSGGCGFNGINGAESYLMITCGPYGPGEYRINKTGETASSFIVLSKTDDLVVCELKDGDITMHITYKKVEVSRKSELNQQGVIIAQ